MRQFDNAFFLPQQSELDRAFDYPYEAPDGGFVFSHGGVVALDDPSLLAGRTAVLSVGSNRAPVQLRRKFGDDAVVPVTPAILHNCDITHAAMLGYYGAVPATAFPSPGCDVTLNVAWLDADQLLQMHRTEALGVAYDYVAFDQGAVTHLPVPEAGGMIVSSEQPIFGYNARSGVLDVGHEAPAGLSRIPAINRNFQAMTQHQAAQFVRELTGHDDSRSMPDFIADMQQDRGARDAILAILEQHALFAETPPWQVLPMTLDDIEAYL